MNDGHMRISRLSMRTQALGDGGVLASAFVWFQKHKWVLCIWLFDAPDTTNAFTNLWLSDIIGAWVSVLTQRPKGGRKTALEVSKPEIELRYGG